MTKYIITIVDEQGLTQLFTKDESTIDTLINNELDGWNNLSSACTGGSKRKESEYFQAGTTRDGKIAFSILCVQN